jgi:hypothetical protein
MWVIVWVKPIPNHKHDLLFDNSWVCLLLLMYLSRRGPARCCMYVPGCHVVGCSALCSVAAGWGEGEQ